MDLVEVDRVDPQTLQAGLCLAQDRTPLEAVHDATPGALQERSLGEHVGTLGEPPQRAPHYRFGVAEAIGGGGVDPVNTLLEGVVNRGDGLVVFLRTPAELPSSAADRPGAEAYSRDFQVGGSELCGL